MGRLFALLLIVHSFLISYKYIKNPYTTVLRALHDFSVLSVFFFLSNFCGKPPHTQQWHTTRFWQWG